MRNKTNYDDFRFQELQNTFRLPPRNRTYVFYNNTSADFDTTPYGVQFARNKFSRYETKNIVNWFRMLHNRLCLQRKSERKLPPPGVQMNFSKIKQNNM